MKRKPPLITSLSLVDARAKRIIALEALAHVGSLLLFPFGIRRHRRRTSRRREQRTIVFIHGYLSNRSLFLPLLTYLRALGLGPFVSFNYRCQDGIEAAAIELRRHLRKHVRGGRIDLICHSMGGLVARVYLQELGGARRVDRCITIATPHRGTYTAYWLLSRAIRDLRPDSSLIARLEKSRDGAAKVKFTSILGGADNIILPREHAAHCEDVVHLPETGHMGLLFSPKVFKEIAKRLLPRTNELP